MITNDRFEDRALSDPGPIPENAYRLKRAGKLTAFIGLENGYALGRDLSLVESFHQKRLAANKDLKYATNASGAWRTLALDTAGNVGRYSDLALDKTGKVHISYYDDGNEDLKSLGHCP